MVFLTLLLITLAFGAPARFPGYSGPELHVDAGYVNVSTSMIYYIHTSLVPPEEVEVVLFWFQGGPGGSSWIGLMEEMGPIQPVSKDEVAYRPVNWLQARGGKTALIFVDNPQCIGFSFTTDENKTQGCASSDSNAAYQNSVVVPTLLDTLFGGAFSTTPFYITGESWGGVYVPTMTAYPSISKRSNFGGVMIGNPVFRSFAPSDPAVDKVGDIWTAFSSLYWNGLVAHEVFEQWRAADCDSEAHRQGKLMPACLAIYKQVDHTEYLGNDFSGDDRFAEPCSGNATLAFATRICASDDPDSLDALVGAYLNNPVNVEALNAQVPFYGQTEYFSYDANLGSTLPYYHTIHENSPMAKILIYSGDLDIQTCPFSYTMPSLYKYQQTYNLKRTRPWKTWGQNGHVFGRWEQHEYLTYSTIKGAGHETPMYSPYQAFEMVDRFLTTATLDSKTDVVKRKRRKKLFPSQSELLKKWGKQMK